VVVVVVVAAVVVVVGRWVSDGWRWRVRQFSSAHRKHTETTTKKTTTTPWPLSHHA
jgi:hypothetical protein